MSLALSLVPVLGLLALSFAYVVWAALRSAQLAQSRAEYQQLTQSIIEQDAELHQAFLTGLVEGRPLAESLEEFQRRRAALVPAARLDDPSGWDSEELQRYAQQQLEQRAAEVNRRLGAGAALTAMTVLGLCAVTALVLYHFQSARPSLSAPVPSTIFDPMAIPTVIPVPSANPSMPAVPRSDPPPGNTHTPHGQNGAPSTTAPSDEDDRAT